MIPNSAVFADIRQPRHCGLDLVDAPLRDREDAVLRGIRSHAKRTVAGLTLVEQAGRRRSIPGHEKHVPCGLAIRSMRFARAQAGVERHTAAAAGQPARADQAPHEAFGIWILLGMAEHGFELHIR